MAKVKPGRDPRGGHVRLYWAMLDSPAWACLSATDQRAYTTMARQLTANSNGTLSLTATQAKQAGIASKTTLAKSLRALVATGFIAVTRQGGCTAGGQREPTLYALTSEPVFERPLKGIEARPATDKWKAVESIAHGASLIAAAEAAAEQEALKLKTQVQKLTHTSPKNGPLSTKTGPKNGPWPARPVQKMDLVKSDENPMLARPSGRFRGLMDFAIHGPKTGLLYMLPSIAQQKCHHGTHHATRSHHRRADARLQALST